MKIQVGIHENVILSKAAVMDKGRLTLFLRQLGDDKKAEIDPFAQMNSTEIVGTESGSGLIMWPFKLPDSKAKDGSTRTQKEIGEMANKDVIRLRDQLTLILQQYMIKDQIKWSIFDSLGDSITKETYYEDLTSQNVLDVIYRNICEQFIAMIQPYLDNDAFPMRWKMTRQSKEKHFATLPGMYLNEQPFIEPMDVPKDLAKVKWSKYEKDQGLDDPTPISRDTADNDTEPTPEGENVFGQR